MTLLLTLFLRQHYLVQVLWVFLSDVSHPSVFSFREPVVLLGGGECTSNVLLQLLQQSYPLIVADGGASHLEDTAIVPDLIIGDLDSLENQSHWESITRVVKLAEQDTTDFEKCLYSVDAPLFIAIGFTGKRLDHTLASLHAAAKYSSQKQVIVVSQDDIVLVCRSAQQVSLDKGMRFSIVPFEPIKFRRSTGLLYPLDGLTLAPTLMIGTSNEVLETKVSLETEPDNDGAYAVILPLDALEAVIKQLFNGL